MAHPNRISRSPRSADSRLIVFPRGESLCRPAFGRRFAVVLEFARSLVTRRPGDRNSPVPSKGPTHLGPILVSGGAVDMREPTSAAPYARGRRMPADQTGPAMNRENREHRRHRRQMCSEVVNISFSDPTGRRVADIGIIEDVNHNGLCLSLGISLPVRAAVKISNEQVEAHARVCHCSPQDYGYSVGLEFAEGFEWDPQQWRPQHLLEIPIDAE